MKTFSQWCLLLALWALVALALFVCAPVHAQVAAGTSASSSSTTTTTTTTAQSAAPQIVQAPLASYMAPPVLQAPLPSCPNFGAPLGYGRSSGFNRFGAGFGYGHSAGFRRSSGAPVGYGVGFAVPHRASSALPVAPVTPVVPVKVGLFGRLRVPRGFRR